MHLHFLLQCDRNLQAYLNRATGFSVANEPSFKPQVLVYVNRYVLVPIYTPSLLPYLAFRHPLCSLVRQLVIGDEAA